MTGAGGKGQEDAPHPTQHEPKAREAQDHAAG